MKARICDKCKKNIPVWDELVQDTIDQEYPNHDICPNCYLKIYLAQSLVKTDLINGWKPGTALQEMMKLYGII